MAMAAAAVAGRRPEAEEDECEPPTLYQGQKMNNKSKFLVETRERNIPISQLTPEKPLAQAQVKVVSEPPEQVPPF